MNKLKKPALKVIAESLSEDEIQGLKQVFENMDTDGSGTITCEELKEDRLGLDQMFQKMNDRLDFDLDCALLNLSKTD